MGYNFGMGYGTGSITPVLQLLIQILFVVFIISVVIGVIYLIKKYFLTREDLEKIKGTFAGTKKTADKTCEICGKVINGEWKVCPYCGKEIIKETAEV